MSRATRVALLALLVTLRPAPVLVAQQRDIPSGLLVVLEGYMGARRPKDWGTTGLWLFTQGNSYQFQLQKLRVVNAGILPNQIITALIPYRPSLFLYGDRTTLARFEAAAPGDAIAITGFTSAMRQLQVSEIVVSPPTATAAPPTAAPAPSD